MKNETELLPLVPNVKSIFTEMSAFMKTVNTMFVHGVLIKSKKAINPHILLLIQTIHLIIIVSNQMKRKLALAVTV